MGEEQKCADRLPFLNPGPQIYFPREARARLCVKVPVRFGNLKVLRLKNNNLSTKAQTLQGWIKITAAFQSSHLICHSRYSSFFFFGSSIISFTITCEIWTPWGPNFRVENWDKARNANLAVVKEAKNTSPLVEAVAPVNIRVGGCVDLVTDDSSSGSAARAKRYAPLL